MNLSTQIKPDSTNIIGLTPLQFAIVIEGLQQCVAGYKFIAVSDLDKESLLEIIMTSNELAGVPTDNITEENLEEILQEFEQKKIEAENMLSVLLTPNVNLN